jgi:hypothetical protein
VFVSDSDNGIYDAINKAASLGCGEYIIFMNAGDMFASRRAIERAFGGCPDDADIIFGNNISLPDSGCERFHQASEFDKIWNLLRTGNLSFSWLMSIPVHQAVFTRRALLLAQGGFSSEFRIAADHELMYRLKNSNAKFYHCGEVISIYAGGGLSARREKECLQDWWRIARLYGERRGVDHFFRNQFSPKNEIGPWTPDVIFGWLIRSIKRMAKRWTRSLMKANRRRFAKRHADELNAPRRL